MIYTLTFNPALDYMVNVPNFQLGKTNRSCGEYMLPGGKGINVSIVLSNLGLETTALGFIAGFTGREINHRLENLGCHTEFVTLPEGESRINVKLQNVEGTEINGKGPHMDAGNLDRLYDKLDKLKPEDVLVLAGSIPGSLPDTVYRDIMAWLAPKGIRIVVDATRGLLMGTLEHRPFLIKPNNHEVGEIFGVQLATREEAVPYAGRLREMGARNVLISMAGEGAVLAAEDGKIYECPAPKGQLVNGVGAGDSMVAGFLAGYLQTGSYEQAFYMSVAAGSASAFSSQLATGEQIQAVLRSVLEWRKTC